MEAAGRKIQDSRLQHGQFETSESTKCHVSTSTYDNVGRELEPGYLPLGVIENLFQFMTLDKTVKGMSVDRREWTELEPWTNLRCR